MVLRETMHLAVLGVVLGIAAAVWLTGILRACFTS
jgi:hypothetical protein